MPNKDVLPQGAPGLGAPKIADGNGANKALPQDAPFAPSAPEAQFTVSLIPGDEAIVPSSFAKGILALEQSLGMPVWILGHADETPFDHLCNSSYGLLVQVRGELPRTPVALIIDSPGGHADQAYQIANLLRNRCGSFTAIVPRYAKSAATLLALGAQEILLNDVAELGPLDAQLPDMDREEHWSALNEALAVERLQTASLEILAGTIHLLHRSFPFKKTDALVEPARRFAAELMRPLFDRLDPVHYNQICRSLKVAEEYAVRLLQPKFILRDAERIARRLVSDYPDHGFVIDFAEAKKLGLHVRQLTDEQTQMIEPCLDALGKLPMLGRVRVKADPGAVLPRGGE